MPLEYCPIKVVVVIQIDVVLGYDASNASRYDPTLYITLNPRK
jgi:hypothetical protein